MSNLRPASDPDSPRTRGALDAFADSLFRRRGAWTAGAVAVLGVALLFASQLGIRSEAADFLPRGTASPDLTLGDLGDADRIVVVIESDRPLTALDIGPALDTLAARLRTLPGVRRVDHRLPAATLDYLSTEFPRHLLLYFTPDELETLGSHLTRSYMERALLKIGDSIPRTRLAVAMGVERTDPLGVVDPALRKLRELGGSMRFRTIDGYFAVPDQRSFFLTVEPGARLTTIDDARSVVTSIDSVLAAVRLSPALQATLAGKRLYAVGRPVAVVGGVDVAVRDVQRVAIASVIVVLALLVLFLRRIMAPIFIVGTVLYGTAVTAGIAYLLFGAINLVSWVFIAALVGFGDEFALYIVSHYWLASARGATRGEALAAALRRPGPGILLGGITSAGAFFVLMVMSYPVMSEVAWVATIGLLVILGSSFTVLPIALTYTEPGRDAATAWYRWTGLTHRVGQTRPHFWLLGWCVLLAGSVALMGRLTWDPHPWKLAVRGIPASAHLEQISERVGASLTPLLMVSRGPTAESALEADRVAVRELDSLKDDAGVAAIVSLSRWVPSSGAQVASLDYLAQHAEVFSAERFRRDFVAVASRMRPVDTALTGRYLDRITQTLAFSTDPISIEQLGRAGMREFVDRHLVVRGGEHLVISDVYLSRIPWAPGAVDQFTAAVTGSDGPGLKRAAFVSDALRGATRGAVLQRDFFLASGLAILFTLLVLGLRFRRVHLVILCLIPLACGICAMLGLMALLRIELNLLTVAAAPLILGLGSDDGIHIVDRLTRGEALGDVLTDTGAPMTITTLTTIAAFACTGLAAFPGVREMGLVASWGLFVCLVASLQLLPLCYRLLPGSWLRP